MSVRCVFWTVSAHEKNGGRDEGRRMSHVPHEETERR